MIKIIHVCRKPSTLNAGLLSDVRERAENEFFAILPVVRYGRQGELLARDIDVVGVEGDILLVQLEHFRWESLVRARLKEAVR